MTASISLLGGQERQLSSEALAERFFVAASDGVLTCERSFQPLDMFAPLPIGPATRWETFSQKFRSICPLEAAIVVASSSQQGFSPCGAAKRPVLPISEHANQELGLQACDEKSGVQAALSSSRSRIENDRMPYVSMIRAMLDRDQVAAARALLSVALAESPSAPELLRTAKILAVPTSVRRPVQDSDRRREYSWLAAHADSHPGKWVAIVGSELVGSAASLTELLESLKSSGAQSLALIHRVD